MRRYFWWIMVIILTMNASLFAKEIEYGKTELYSEIGSHALAFDGEGNLYIAKDGRSIYRITPDRKAIDVADLDAYPKETHIWSMEVGSDGNIYCAAQDRVLKVSVDGEITTHIKENFTGPCGMTDIEFDSSGNLYVVYDDIVARYTPEIQKTVVIEGRKQKTFMPWIVGIKFDLDYKHLYLSDLRGRRVAKYSINPDGTVSQEPLIIDLFRYPEYFAIDKKGDVYVSLPDNNYLVRIKEGGSISDIRCEEKLVFPTTLSVNNLEEDWLYIACRNGIYRTYIGNE